MAESSEGHTNCLCPFTEHKNRFKPDWSGRFKINTDSLLTRAAPVLTKIIDLVPDDIPVDLGKQCRICRTCGLLAKVEMLPKITWVRAVY